MTKQEIHEAPQKPLANYLRAHRLKSSFTQNEVARILGRESRAIVSHHERFESLPSLFVALSYEVLYRIPVSELFTGLTEMVEIHVEAELAEFETHLGKQSASGPGADAVARKLEWLSERRSSGCK
jgi:DNA-binding XRE family transcriptional regulator